jgi:hypothetical protein
MQAAMSASRVPTVREHGGRYSVAIAEGVTLTWWFKLDKGGCCCTVQVDGPGLKDWREIDSTGDRLSFPVQ